MKLTCTKSGLGVEAGKQYPVLSENKLAWVIVIGQMEKKVTKSTGLFAGAPKGGPSFELVTVTEKQLDLIPQVRPRGRPATGKALTPAEKQARYRARKAQKAVTVTFNREHFEQLDTFIRGIRQGHSVDLQLDALEGVYKAIRDAAFFQLAIKE
ncbi:hypothetical protein [Aeromonas salmonicida]|uniref:hypothetical protein n=1 Tax=Aeromonas salmonicida TaxID=645 RepID=UPI000740F36E|nr:hypothetical protein [Aeromonas salmonicida]MDE7526816.1 hypothetical protein [Aeromonas salmonicida]MDE7530852.1 hypothetical protein [Aeromonas salmonicida]MDE7530863.1 hypothetical protein [Aeromonas salmonicida]